MLGIEDAVERAFTKTRLLREGYEIADVDEFCVDVVEAITCRDRVIRELQDQLVRARMQLVDAGAERGDPDGNPQESPVAAARLLEMASVTADQLVADARAEADSLMSAADAEAERLITAGRSEAARVSAEFADVRAALEARVETLRHLESEHRNRLRCHFAEQLAQLEDDTPAPLRAVAD